MNERLRSLILHQEALKNCVRCAGMIGPVVMGRAVLSPVVLIGQAPGAKEGQLGKPFAWTAGKTLFKWFAEIGIRRRFSPHRLHGSRLPLLSRQEPERRRSGSGSRRDRPLCRLAERRDSTSQTQACYSGWQARDPSNSRCGSVGPGDWSSA